MNNKYLIGGIVVILVVAAGIGAALYTGVGPAPGGDSGDEIDEFPTEDDTDTDGSDTTAPDDPFSFTIDNIEECGETCRDVTATLDNNQNETATDVTIYIRIFAGQDNTDTDDIVWEGTEDAGTMEAGADHTTSERVELSLQDARKIDQEDGWITILTTIESDDTTITFQDSERVA